MSHSFPARHSTPLPRTPARAQQHSHRLETRAVRASDEFHRAWRSLTTCQPSPMPPCRSTTGRCGSPSLPSATRLRLAPGSTLPRSARIRRLSPDGAVVEKRIRRGTSSEVGASLRRRCVGAGGASVRVLRAAPRSRACLYTHPRSSRIAWRGSGARLLRRPVEDGLEYALVRAAPRVPSRQIALDGAARIR